MDYSFTTIGALIGMAVAIILIIKKVQPAYSLILGALIGGVIGSGNLILTVDTMVSGAQSMISSVLRIMTSGIPAVCALIVTVIIATILSKKAGTMVSDQDLEKHADNKKLPTFIQAFAGPLTVIILLALRPIFSIVIDPLIALPLGGLVCAIACGSLVQFREFAEFGLSKVAGVSILLIGTGTIAGIIKASALQYDVISLLEMMKMPAFILAPIAGILMAGATASTTAGATIASQTFAQTLLNAGIPAISAGAMIHAGATVIDSLPHGSFFHATGGSVGMNIKERMKLIPFEACIGLTSTIVAVIVYLI